MSNFVNVCDLANAPYELSFSLSSSRVFVALHRFASESFGTTSPVFPWIIKFLNAPTSAATTGTPQAIDPCCERCWFPIGSLFERAFWEAVPEIR